MSGWTDETWDAFCGLIDEAWPGHFDDHAQRSWRVLLGDLEPERAIEGLKRLLFEGHTFRPSVSEFLACVRRDPSQPTFDEAYRLIFGRGGILAARAPTSGRYGSEAERDKAHNRARLQRAREMHPLVGTFAHRYGIDRLVQLGVDDEDWGAKRRSDLERSWDAHVKAFDDRQVAALAAGGGDADAQRGLQRFDPLAVLGLGNERTALPVGSER